MYVYRIRFFNKGVVSWMQYTSSRAKILVAYGQHTALHRFFKTADVCEYAECFRRPTVHNCQQ